MKNLLKLSCIIALLFLLAQEVESQTRPCPTNIGKKYNNWYFGRFGAITFNTPSPTPLNNTSQMYAPEGSASISDINGTLLFYTNGKEVYNSAHQLVTDQLCGGWETSKQAALIIPRPNMSNRYYIFTTPDQTKDGLNQTYLYYTEIQVSGSNVTVVSGTLNTLVNTGHKLSERMTAACDSLGDCIWLINHSKDNDTFLFSKINVQNGNVSFSHSQKIGGFNGRAGEMRVSLDNKHLALAGGWTYNLLELYDFYSSTGKLGNYRYYQGSTKPYTLEFSPDGRFLYAGNIKYEQYDAPPDLHQWEVSNFPNSFTSIAQPPSFGWNDGIWALQLGPDGKIYCGGRSRTDLYVINNPNEAGTNCSFTHALTLPFATPFYMHSLPNIAYLCCYNQSEESEPCANENCLVTEINMSTGYGKTPNDIDRDDNWLLIDGPDITGYDYPRLPFVKDYAAWAEIDNSNWIGIKPGMLSNNNPNDPYVFERCFCFCDSAWIKMKLIILADDKISIRFNNNTIYTTPSANDGYAHIRRDTVEINRFVTAGTYCMYVDLYNLHGTITGFNISGTMTATRNGQPVSVLLTEECCNPHGRVCGKKILDLNCNGRIDNDDVGLQGWTIQLIQDDIVFMAATTSDDGSYCFNNVPNGSYTIQEVQQDG